MVQQFVVPLFLGGIDYDNGRNNRVKEK
jgi:hypothetical protein